MEKIETPKRIFKYTSFDIAKIIVSSSCIKFSHPADFNDPFDCDIDLLDFQFNSEAELNDTIKAEIVLLKDRFKDTPGFTELSRDDSFWARGYRETQIGKIKSCRICCFSLVNNSILMWSHYAEKHFGICLEFDNYISPRFVNLSEKDISEGIVGYSEYERINYMNNEKKYSLFKLFLSKSVSWNHEQEYRMILLNGKDEIQKFYKPFLSAIYFGLRTTDSERNEIVSLCLAQGYNDMKYFNTKKNSLSIQFYKI